MELSEVADLLEEQSGVVRRAQLHDLGARDHDLERWLRRRELARVHPRVYVDHTGPVTWLQRAWAAVLWAHPAALSHESALRAADRSRHDTGADDGPIHVLVSEGRRLVEVPGIVVHRSHDYAARVLDLAPPRVRLEHAVLDLAAAARTDLDAIGVLADAVGSRRTTAARLLACAADRPRLARRELITAVLTDAASGTCSALERWFLDRVVRPHGLPEGTRQASHRHGGDQRYLDVLIAFLLLCIELDGRLVHGTAKARDRDLDRDLVALVDDDLLTVRLGWGQVAERSCLTAERLGRLAQKRGWTGAAHLCEACRRSA